MLLICIPTIFTNKLDSSRQCFLLNIHIQYRAYGFIPCLQPSAATDGFARIYAAYGGFFIVMSFLIGWALEGESAKPDLGDIVGGTISLVGALVIVFWPRR